ncbi:(d)CMP kinase [Methylococcus sp. EFPC2]|uniref:(d)CMP kinase n=1 Tax=Methylococcus sp. EFPC2 TaxID=2812648 RepID=UPI0019671D46|nr:(d)CMP kinase [Methylococcus sp. EFPC2]QSA95548.1 (d)CMP kinase [Methylococcus sp. EFPC2]
MSTRIPVVALDGPSGAGKGTVARALARTLGWHYLDSGAIYRSLAVAVLDSGLALDDVDGIVQLASRLDLRFPTGETRQVLLNGVDISDRIDTETCGNTASKIAAYGPVRKALLQKQRDFRLAPGLVADGRDMGTVVFTDAPIKIFLTASAEERAQRRYKQLMEKGIDVNLADLTSEIEERDRRDRERAEAPLKMADGAVLVDTSELSISQVVARCLSLVKG